MWRLPIRLVQTIRILKAKRLQRREGDGAQPRAAFPSPLQPANDRSLTLAEEGFVWRGMAQRAGCKVNKAIELARDGEILVVSLPREIASCGCGRQLAFQD